MSLSQFAHFIARPLAANLGPTSGSVKRGDIDTLRFDTRARTCVSLLESQHYLLYLVGTCAMLTSKSTAQTARRLYNMKTESWKEFRNPEYKDLIIGRRPGKLPAAFGNRQGRSTLTWKERVAVSLIVNAAVY
jgi:hypothetical protein